MTHDGADATELLKRLAGGEERAREDLLALVYDELRRVAASFLRGERGGHTLQPTALVHEAWVRLVDQDAAGIEGRRHFLRLAASMMRRVLVDHARARRAEKRGGGARAVELDSDLTLAREPDEQLERVDLALERLALASPRQARIVELRWFAGLSVAEAAAVEGVSERTVEGEWRVARAWLAAELEELRP